MNPRIKCLRNQLNSLGIEGMIISNPINIKYLTGIDAEGELLIARKENIFLTDSRYIEAVNSALTIDSEIVVWDKRGMARADYENFFLFCESVGFEESYVTYEKYKQIMQLYKINELIETEGIIEKQRRIKDEEEIENIKKACEITDRCFEFLKQYIKIGMTEREISYKIEEFFIKNGAEGLAFKPIVASGANSSMPHSIVTDKKIEYGDILLLDLGCKYNGYCSDMTRTIFIGKINDTIKSAYDLVLKVQEDALTQCKDGANIKNITKAAEQELKINRFDLVHALGHGVGLDVHEDPVLSSRYDNLLKENMVIAVEPGVYIPKSFGIRLEDTVLITKNGCIKLTNSAKNYTVI
ncbi:MAG: aminopeptidase P family protein [Clostridia bacterium]|nr:aminopeptidase P family protein [Clostridia bacterium]